MNPTTIHGGMHGGQHTPGGKGKQG
jgi:hypothetical protein